MGTLSRKRPDARVAPGEVLLHPMVLVALAVLVVNDHWLKAAVGAEPYANVVTGKLSDVVGLVFFPLLLVSLLEVVRWCRPGGRAWPARWAYTRGELAAAVVFTVVGFVAVQSVPLVGDAYAWSVAALRWWPGAVVALATGGSPASLVPVNHVMDASDNLCVSAAWLGFHIGKRRGRELSSGRETMASAAHGRVVRL